MKIKYMIGHKAHNFVREQEKDGIKQLLLFYEKSLLHLLTHSHLTIKHNYSYQSYYYFKFLDIILPEKLWWRITTELWKV